ncbi:MAG TPA: DoxX family protein, partial [Haliangiales bacterium]|nr:DoxX family protein [Haliangiales bacterium]
ALDAAITNFRDNFGMPFPEITAPFVSTVEFVSGILLLAGFLTRFAAIALMINMLVAVFAYFWKEVPDKLNLLGIAEAGYVIMSAWLAVAGAGPLSLDHWIGKKLARS